MDFTRVIILIFIITMFVLSAWAVNSSPTAESAGGGHYAGALIPQAGRIELALVERTKLVNATPFANLSPIVTSKSAQFPPPSNLDQGRSATTKPTAPFVIDLTFSETPAVGRKVDLVFTVTPLTDVATGTIEFMVPDEGFRVVDGSLDWNGKLVRDQERQFTITVVAISEGDWTLSASVISFFRSNQREGKTAFLFVSIGEGSVTVSRTPSLTRSERGHRQAVKIGDSSTAHQAAITT